LPEMRPVKWIVSYSTASLRHFLEQLSFPEVKAIYVIIQGGRNPSWLAETRSVVPLYVNLSGIRPANEGKQSCIYFLLPKTNYLQAYIARYIETCNKLRFDPFEGLGLLIQDEIVQEHCSNRP
jgi:hypothetical protein